MREQHYPGASGFIHYMQDIGHNGLVAPLSPSQRSRVDSAFLGISGQLDSIAQNYRVDLDRSYRRTRDRFFLGGELRAHNKTTFNVIPARSREELLMRAAPLRMTDYPTFAGATAAKGCIGNITGKTRVIDVMLAPNIWTPFVIGTYDRRPEISGAQRAGGAAKLEYELITAIPATPESTFGSVILSRSIFVLGDPAGSITGIPGAPVKQPLFALPFGSEERPVQFVPVFMEGTSGTHMLKQ